MKAGINLSISVALSLIPVLLLSSCAQERTLAGLWKGDRDWRALHLDSEAVARARAAVDLDLKKDGMFVLKDGGEPFTGIWRQTSTSIDLTVETYMNKPIEKMIPSAREQLEFKVRVENGRLFYRNYVGESEIELKK